MAEQIAEQKSETFTASRTSARTSSRTRQAETAELVQRLRTAGPSEQAPLRDRLVEVNLSLANALASRYAGRGVETADLEQVAALGLMAAARRFDPARGDEFLAFAVPTIRGELRKAFRNLGWMVRPPRRLQELQAQIRTSRHQLEQELQRTPRPSELADQLGVGLDEVIEALSIDGCYRPRSLDLPASPDDQATLGDRQAVIDEGFERAEMHTILDPAMNTLGERDRLILRLRFVEGWTQAQIGEQIGVTQMQVSRLISRILGDLRSVIEQPAA
jgi:RNA polymerase sigma-B factor